MGLPTISKSSIVGGVGLFLSGLWRVYSYYTTAASLPDDVGAVWKMLADPPVYLPWLFIAGFAILLGWAIWPRKGTDGVDNDDDKGGGSGGNSTRGDGSHVIKDVHGNVTVNTHPPTPTGGSFTATNSTLTRCGVGIEVWGNHKVNLVNTEISDCREAAVRFHESERPKQPKAAKKYHSGFSFSKGDDKPD